MAISTSLFGKRDSKVAGDATVGLTCPQLEVKDVVDEVACDIHGSYVLKSQNEPFRDVVIKLLRGKSDGKLKKADICAAAEAAHTEVTNTEYTRPMPLAPATKRTREKQPIRRKATRKSPPPSEPPSSSQHAGPSVETLAAASSGTKSRFKFMETPGLKQQ
ncbi:hypothetical protein PIB30_107115 [Stylosanthes scabra]|uniref:Uncharacterized protein n=1 Tax=Stylosanthes scabra TaxID=79078 RepID=A0ABU6QZZ2_9FABA|nr:hypothetical protein [Stylosanthes scabra]